MKETLTINGDQYFIYFNMNGIEWLWQGAKIIGDVKPTGLTLTKPIFKKFKTKEELIEHIESKYNQEEKQL